MRAPVTLMVEGVHAGNHGPLYRPAHVLKAAAPSWEGVPVTWTHPAINDVAVSVNHSPEIRQRFAIGWITKPFYDERQKALKGTIQKKEAALYEA